MQPYIYLDSVAIYLNELEVVVVYYALGHGMGVGGVCVVASHIHLLLDIILVSHRHASWLRSFAAPLEPCLHHCMPCPLALV